MTLIRHVPLRRSTPASRALGRLMLKRRHELLRRSGGVCERCGTSLTVLTVDPHHRQRRREGRHGLDNLVGLCRPDHRFLTEHPAAGHATGMVVSFTEDPAMVAVVLWDRRRVRLDPVLPEYREGAA